MQIPPRRPLPGTARPAAQLRTQRAGATGGSAGNSRLTGAAAAILLVLLAVEGLTLLSLQSFLSWHIFVGMLLVPIVLLKLASTGYRFTSYYIGRREYVEAGPPPILLRLLGPLVVVSTLALFGTGVTLAAIGPGRGIVLGLHKASFVVWAGAVGVHFLTRIGPVWRALTRRVPALTFRMAAATLSVVAGVAVATATLPAIDHLQDDVSGHVGFDSE